MPDGVPVSFPDNMPPSEIKSFIASKFPNEALKSEFESKKSDKLGTARAFVNSFNDAVPAGGKITSAIAAGIAAPFVDETFGQLYNRAEETERLDSQNHPVASGLGTAAGIVNSLPLWGASIKGVSNAASSVPILNNIVRSGQVAKTATIPQQLGGAAIRGIKNAAVAAPIGALYAAGDDQDVSTGAGVAAGVAGALPIVGVGARIGLNALNTKVNIPNAEGVRKYASNLFKEYDKRGGVLSAQETDDFFNQVSSMRPQTEFGTATRGSSPVDDLIERWQGFKGKDLTFQAAKEADEQLGDLAYSTMDNFGKVDADGQKFLKIQQALREKIYAAPGGETLNKARKAWSASLHMRDIERIIARAERSDQPASMLRTGFRTLLNNAKNTKGISKDELAALEYAAKTGITTDLLRLVGSGLVPIGAAVTGGAAAGPIGAAAAGTAAYGLQQGAKALATGRQLDRATNALESIAKNSGAVTTQKRIDLEKLQKAFELKKLKGK